MRRVIVESPYKGKTDEETERNLVYLRRCLHDCFMRGEAPFAGHGLYTQDGVLNDKILEERNLGIEAALEWARAAGEASVVYTDYGISNGMREKGIPDAKLHGRPIDYREIGKNP